MANELAGVAHRQACNLWMHITAAIPPPPAMQRRALYLQGCRVSAADGWLSASPQAGHATQHIHPPVLAGWKVSALQTAPGYS